MSNIETEAIFFDIGGTLVKDADNWIPGAKRVLEELGASGFRLGLISNTGGLDRIQLTSHLPNDFDFDEFHEGLILLSGEIGFEKPDIRIFLQAIRQAALPPWRCVFVGESLKETFAAQRAGMRAVRVVQTMENMKELPSLLE